MLSSFLQEVALALRLTDAELRVLAAVDVRSWEDLHSLVTDFPSVDEFGVRLPELSFAARRNSSAAYVAAASELDQRDEPPRIAGSHGAIYPQGSPWQPGSSVPLPTGPVGTPSGATAGSGSGGSGPPTQIVWPTIDLRCQGWPVRDQGHRATCVSFAVAAAHERIAAAAQSPGPDDLSEQFLHWAVKNVDTYRHEEGSTLHFGGQALRHKGVCQEALWPYDPTKATGPFGPGHGPQPTPWMLASASQNCHIGAQLYRQFKPSERGAAQLVIDQLEAGKVVAVTVPVFKDHRLPGAPDNWSTNGARLLGRIGNPPPGAVECGGHAVCIVGCLPDVTEATGGYFVFRNSWGSNWASMAPTNTTLSPESGYGVLTGSYIEFFPWEMLVL